MGKMNLWLVARGYLSTLVDARTEKISPIDMTVQVAAPVVCGVVFYFVWPLSNEAVENLAEGFVSGVSIVSALLCGVAVMVFQLRLQLASQTKPQPTLRESKLIDEMFYDVLWAVVVGFGSVLLLVLRDAAPFGLEAWKAIVSVAGALLLNFIMVTCMCLKRLGAAYEIVSKYWAPKR
ncbi:hypothetical protein [Enorma massiliensis]|uniref:hypothetical protein n=1 Tax=Enorma massiliensis TaxID=1472761 RepID=UPI003AF1CD33